jgi:glycopeptide antibiotics resistance protein
VYRPPTRWAQVAFGLWVILILFVVTPWYGFRDHSHWARVQWIPFVSPPIRITDIVLNTLFYVPFGLMYVRRSRSGSVWKAVAAGALLSLATEVTQVYSHGRFPSTTDLICNTAGAYIGALWAGSRRG